MKKQVTYEQASELRNLGYEFWNSKYAYRVFENGDIALVKKSMIKYYTDKAVQIIACPDTTDLFNAFFEFKDTQLVLFFHNVDDYHPTRFFKENKIEVVVHGKDDCKSFATAELVDNLVDALVWLKTEEK